MFCSDPILLQKHHSFLLLTLGFHSLTCHKKNTYIPNPANLKHVNPCLIFIFCSTILPRFSTIAHHLFFWAHYSTNSYNNCMYMMDRWTTYICSHLVIFWWICNSQIVPTTLVQTILGQFYITFIAITFSSSLHLKVKSSQQYNTCILFI